MSFNYSEDPATSKLDEVRFLLGDTDADEALLADEEINYALAKWEELGGSVEYVASKLAEDVAARYAREAHYSADGVSVSLGPVGDQYRKLAAHLREQHKSLLVGGSPDVGGVSPYEERDPDIRQFAFGTGMHDELSAGPQDYGDQGATWPREH